MPVFTRVPHCAALSPCRQLLISPSFSVVKRLHRWVIHANDVQRFVDRREQSVTMRELGIQVEVAGFLLEDTPSPGIRVAISVCQVDVNPIVISFDPPHVPAGVCFISVGGLLKLRTLFEPQLPHEVSAGSIIVLAQSERIRVRETSIPA